MHCRLKWSLAKTLCPTEKGNCHGLAEWPSRSFFESFSSWCQIHDPNIECTLILSNPNMLYILSDPSKHDLWSQLRYSKIQSSPRRNPSLPVSTSKWIQVYHKWSNHYLVSASITATKSQCANSVTDCQTEVKTVPSQSPNNNNNNNNLAAPGTKTPLWQ